ncbi:DUF7344 domain-containing protein [Halostella litorea]|uniref:DUF7344 domain-containing protein n=1 Tax=Halostella litorea TaxID=2528831 RepID=UPI001092BF1B|nr:hypothetical protein [Halostella litorea]
MATQGGGLSDKDELFSILSNHRRRYTIQFCKQEEGAVTLSDLAEQVAAWEEEKTVSEITSAERKRVYTSLQQTHLPTLADAGMIEYEDHEIELTDAADELDVYMDVVPEDSIPWGVYYLGLSVVGGGVLGAVGLGLLPTEPIPELGWAAVVLGLFAVSAVVHIVQNRRMRLGEMERPP